MSLFAIALCMALSVASVDRSFEFLQQVFCYASLCILSMNNRKIEVKIQRMMSFSSIIRDFNNAKLHQKINK